MASVFLKEFTKSIFLVLHPEMSEQIRSGSETKSEMQVVRIPKDFVSSKPIRGSFMPFGAGQGKTIKLPPFRPRVSAGPSVNVPYSTQFSAGQGMTASQPIQMGSMKVPIPSYKMQQYFSKNKEWPTIVVPSATSNPNQSSSQPQSQGLNVSQGPNVSFTTNPENSKFDSLVYLLSDPTVSSIECTGPGKPIVLNKSGNIENSNLTLTQEEVSAVMEEVARKTNQKVDSGFLRASIGNFNVSAVISDFVGTRFVMQKKQGNAGTPGGM